MPAAAETDDQQDGQLPSKALAFSHASVLSRVPCENQLPLDRWTMKIYGESTCR
jgi:hypothetical protein